MNPTYYGLEDSKPATINKYLSTIIDNTLRDLESAGCIGN